MTTSNQIREQLKQAAKTLANTLTTEAVSAVNAISEGIKSAYTTKANDISDIELAEILRLNYDAISNREILQKLGITTEATK
jgi:hypothetical protein